MELIFLHTNTLLISNKKVIVTQRYFLKYFKKYIGRTHTDTKFKNNLVVSIFCNSQNVNYKNIYNVFPQIFCGIFIFKKLMEIRNSYDIIYKQKNVKGVINMQEQEFPLSQENKSVDKTEKERELIVLINSKGTFTSEITSENKNLLVANAELIAYIDCITNELHKTKAKIEWLITVEDSKRNFIYNIEKYHIYHLKVKETDTNNFLLIDVLERNLENKLLEETLKECEQKAAIVIEEPDLGKFILDKNLKAFLSKIEWLNPKKPINISLNVEENTRIKALEKVGAFFNTLEKLIGDKKEWDKKLKIYAAENLVDLANELRKNLKGMFKFIKIWKWRFIGKIELISLAINPNGEFVATFDDKKLFVGHKIVVNGNVNGELLNSVVVENFNIEDYKKAEIPPVIPENISVSDNNISDNENKE